MLRNSAISFPIPYSSQDGLYLASMPCALPSPSLSSVPLTVWGCLSSSLIQLVVAFLIKRFSQPAISILYLVCMDLTSVLGNFNKTSQPSMFGEKVK